MRKFLNTVVAVAAVAAFAAPASADPIFVDGISETRVSISVDLSGLNAEQADRRIARAARKVCGNADILSTEMFARINSCRSAAVADARDQLASASGPSRVVVAAIY